MKRIMTTTALMACVATYSPAGQVAIRRRRVRQPDRTLVRPLDRLVHPHTGISTWPITKSVRASAPAGDRDVVTRRH